jgi:uncharacterized protein YoxC
MEGVLARLLLLEADRAIEPRATEVAHMGGEVETVRQQSREVKESAEEAHKKAEARIDAIVSELRTAPISRHPIR